MHHRRPMKPLILLLCVCFLPALLSLRAGPRGANPQDGAEGWAELQAAGEQFMERGSFAEAAQSFTRALGATPSAEALPELRFLEVDARWRSLGSTRRSDTSELDSALQELDAMWDRDLPREERTELWARMAESRGDSRIQIQHRMDVRQAWTEYSAAQDFWARSSDIDAARERWLAIVLKYAWPAWVDDRSRYGDWGNWVPVEVLEQALEIARKQEDLTRLHFLMARSATFRKSGPFWDARVRDSFAAVRRAGKEGGLLDASLWFEAQWLENTGRWTRDEFGTATREQEPEAALDLYRALVASFKKSESRFHASAQQGIEDLNRVELRVTVGRAFYPGSKVAADVQVRNLASVSHELYAFDMLEDVEPTDRDMTAYDWIESLRTPRLKSIAEWTQEIEGGKQLGWTRSQERLPEDLGPGAYLWIARSKDVEVRQLVLVSDAALILKASGRQLVAWSVDARTGEPIEGAEIRVHGRRRGGDLGSWVHAAGTTGPDGVANIELPYDSDSIELLVVSEAAGAPSVALLNTQITDPGAGWRVQVVTDRPAYRPGQTVSWKLLARKYEELRHTTPAGAKLNYQLTGPRGEDLESGDLTLSTFGTTFGAFELESNAALGEYRIQLRTEDGNWISQATLFRLEEYKLPEFEVSVATPTGEDGRRAVYVLGDEVSAEITARTYFGSPVAGGTVEAVLRRKPSHVMIQPREPWAWFTSSLDGGNNDWMGYRGWQPDEEVLRRELTLDAEGKAELRFDTPFGEGQDYEYTIEARVTDASRREVTGSGSVRVARQSYAALVDLEHRVFEPGAPIEATFRTEDANGAPLAVRGTARLLQVTQIEFWVGSDGRRIASGEVAAARSKGLMPRDWILLRTDVDYREAARLELTTNAEGEGTWSPSVSTPGVYVVRWSSVDERSGPVTAETQAYVAAAGTTQLAYSSPGLTVLLDRGTIAEGETAQILVMSDASNRHVLFSVEATSLMSAEVLHLEGSVKLVSIPLDARHVPNVRLTAHEMRDGQLVTATEELLVPPARRFLDVDVTLERETYRPGEEASLAVQVKDIDGNPVEAELSLSLIDASVLAIQARYDSDPRTFFFGHRRWPTVSTGSTADRLPFVSLAEDKNGELVDARFARSEEFDEQLKEGFGSTRSRESARGAVGALGYSDSASLGERMKPESAVAFEMQASKDSMSPAAPVSGGGSSIEVRSDFRETAVWLPNLTTDATGAATLEFTFPDSTTSWEVSAAGGDAGDRFGHFEERLARTELPLIVRPQMPRFLITGDESALSAVLTNTTGSPLMASVWLELEGLEVQGPGTGWLMPATLLEAGPIEIEVPANGDARVDWRVRGTEAGRARIVMRALAGELGDAVQRELPVLPHGIEVLLGNAGRLAAASTTVELEVPPAVPGTASLEIQVAPSLATTMLDALPYLTHYPYGCLEQTLSRFVPTAVAIRTLEKLGLDPNFVASASFGGVEQAFAAQTQPLGRDSFGEFTKAAAEGIDRVVSQQRGDGSWSWWPGGPENAWMTGYALWSLSLARDARLDVPTHPFDSGRRWIEQNIVRYESDLDLQAWLLHAWVMSFDGSAPSSLEESIAKASDRLFEQRAALNASGRALLTLAEHHLGHRSQAATLAENLANGAIRIDPGQGSLDGTSGGVQMPTAHWGSDGVTWRWAQDGIESTALTLRALLAVQPDHELVVPAMTWLVQNRRAAQWKSTRDTAICVLALSDYLETSGEASTPTAFAVYLDDELLGERRLEGQELLTRAASFTVADPAEGAHRLRIERTEGTGPLYWSTGVRAFSAEEPIAPRANQLFVHRDVYRLVGRDTLLAGKLFERQLLQPGDQVISGERVEVVLTLQATNDFEYLKLEDWKPAGLEATVVKSGGGVYARQLRADSLKDWLGEQAERERSGDSTLSIDAGTTGRSIWTYRELRDHAQVYFIDALPEGLWQLRSTLRVEVPGTFHGLPAIGEAMYAPEIRGNSGELVIEVLDR